MAGLRSQIVATAIIGTVAVAGAAALAGGMVSVGLAYAVKAAVVFALAMTVAIRFSPAHPFPQFGPANYVTTVRLGLASLTLALAGEAAVPALAWAAAVATLVSAVLDGIDGRLARRTNVASAFGARYDMETDALLIVALSIVVWQHGKAGVWVLASGLMRYVFVAGGRAYPWLRRALPPSVRRQAICVLQVAGLAIAAAPAVTSLASAWIAGVALAALAWSFAIDVAWLWRNRSDAGLAATRKRADAPAFPSWS